MEIITLFFFYLNTHFTNLIVTLYILLHILCITGSFIFINITYTIYLFFTKVLHLVKFQES